MLQRTLPNGLRVVVLQLPHVHSVSCALMVRAGPRYETPEQNGISHLVEHLLFRGTVTRPSSLGFHVAVEELGGEINGLTQRDATTIHLTVPPRSAEAGLALLGEVCTEPLLTGLSIERDVVIEEIMDTLDADGFDLDIDTLSRRALWQDHPMSWPVAGEVGRVERFSEADCRAHFGRTFVAENAVLVAAGRLDPEAMVTVAARAFGKMPRGARLAEVASPVPLVRPPVHVRPTDDAQVSVLLTYPAPHENHEDFAALLLLKRILDDGFASRLRQAICEQRGLAYSLAVSIDAYGDAAALDLEVSCAPRKVLNSAEQMLAVLTELVSRPIPAEELERAKTRHVAEMEFALDDPSELCGWYGASELIGCQAGLEVRLEEVLAVTPERMHALAQRMFHPDAALLTLVGPAAARDVRKLERLLDRKRGSTVWIGGEEPGPARESGLRIAG